MGKKKRFRRRPASREQGLYVKGAERGPENVQRRGGEKPNELANTDDDLRSERNGERVVYVSGWV